MSALGIALTWVALATVAFLVLSASALTRTHRELEADPWIPGENPWIRGEDRPVEAHSAQTRTRFTASDRAPSPALPSGTRTLWTRPQAAASQPRLGVARREHRGVLADASW